MTTAVPRASLLARARAPSFSGAGNRGRGSYRDFKRRRSGKKIAGNVGAISSVVSCRPFLSNLSTRTARPCAISYTILLFR